MTNALKLGRGGGLELGLERNRPALEVAGRDDEGDERDGHHVRDQEQDHKGLANDLSGLGLRSGLGFGFAMASMMICQGWGHERGQAQG